MRHRPSPDREVIDERWHKDKRGAWRHKAEEVSEVAFCQRATRESEGFHKGAKVTAASREDGSHG